MPFGRLRSKFQIIRESISRSSAYAKFFPMQFRGPNEKGWSVFFLSVANWEVLFDCSQRSGMNSFGRQKFREDRYALHWLKDMFVPPGSHSPHTIPPSVGVTLG